MRGRAHIALIVFLIGAYLSTWSAALLHTIVFPALGTRPEKVSASGKPSKDAPRVVFSQRRHMPLVKVLSVDPAPPARADIPRLHDWGTRLPDPARSANLLSPTRAAHAGRAPPSC